MNDMVNLLDFDAQGLLAYCESLGEKSFRAKQLQRWIHQSGAADFGEMTDLAKSLREKLATRATIQAPAVISDHLSSDGTRKWLVDVGAGNAVETVYIPEETRGTLCVSSQAGCAVNCRFCSTGKQGSRATSAQARSSASCGWPSSPCASSSAAAPRMTASSPTS